MVAERIRTPLLPGGRHYVALGLLLGASVTLSCASETSPYEGCSTSALGLCQPSQGYENPYEGVLELLTWEDTLRKASLELVGSLPTDTQYASVREEGQAGLEASLFEMMREEAFFSRIKELFNDTFLTDKYLGRDNALSLLSQDDFPNLRWYEDFGDGGTSRETVNDAVAREVLELIAYVIRENRSFQEILTADYTMANGHSAPALIGRPGVPLPMGDDRERFRPIRIPGIPHAGILTSAMFLNRFPTSDTNVNRHRSAKTYDYFLASDVEALGLRPIDADVVDTEDPISGDPNCTVCHAVMDPVASCFSHWNELGRYNPDASWDDTIRAAGFGGEMVPESDRYRSLQWLAKRLVAHPRFPFAMVRLAFEGLTGQKLMRAPDALAVALTMPTPGTDHADLPEPAPTFISLEAQQRAYAVQQQIIGEVARRFVASDYNFRALVREIMLTPYFRAAGAASAEPSVLEELHTFGTARLLTPEHLHRKVRATLGYTWRARPDRPPHLLSNYRIFYGGIDSDLVTNRITSPNGVIAAVAERMSYEVACKVVPKELAQPSALRVILRDVDPSLPADQQAEAIDSAIRLLHWRLLGENLAVEHPEIQATRALFFDIWETGRAEIEAEEVETSLSNECRYTRDLETNAELSRDARLTDDPHYTVRAMIATVAYLLTDYRFLFE